MQQIAHRHRHQRLHAAVKHGWTSFLQAARSHREPRVLARAPMATPMAAVDPVALTMLAVNRLGPATLRTATHGRALTIEVPDAQIAEIFCAALQEMQKTRRTDRLVDVVVAGPAMPAKRGRDVGNA
jgi:hypothetical protein